MELVRLRAAFLGNVTMARASHRANTFPLTPVRWEQTESLSSLKKTCINTCWYKMSCHVLSSIVDTFRCYYLIHFTYEKI